MAVRLHRIYFMRSSYDCWNRFSKSGTVATRGNKTRRVPSCRHRHDPQPLLTSKSLATVIV